MWWNDEALKPFRLDRERRWQTLAILAWVVTLVVFVVIFIAHPDQKTGFSPYFRGAQKWLAAKDIYSSEPNKGFVYSPLVAVFFSAFTFLPFFLANIVWRWLSAAFLLGGLWAIFRYGPFSHIPARLRGLIFLLVLPVAAGNLDSGQANPIVIGLIMIACAAACIDRWTIVALAVVGAFYWKLYPLTIGMLLILMAPVKLSWRLVLLLVVGALLPFLFQSRDYVEEQYSEWYSTRIGDNRLQYPMAIAPYDLWFLLKWALKIQLPEIAYHLIRVAAGAAIAVFCLYGRWKSWPRERIIGGIFSFTCVWMLLLGPASESLTYMILIPATAIGLVESFCFRMSPAARITASLGYGLLIFAILRVGFFSKFQDPWILSTQPIGALCFLVYCLLRYLDNRQWPNSPQKLNA